MNQQLEGKEALDMLYDSGLIKINNNKRLTRKKEELFIKLWENYGQSYKLIAKDIYIEYSSVKTYASCLFNIIGKLVGEKITQSTLKSSVSDFLLKPKAVDANAWKGSLVKKDSILRILNDQNQEFVRDYACHNNFSEAEAVNAIIDERRNSF